MKWIKTFESLKGEKININDIIFIYDDTLGYFYKKYINENKIVVRIDKKGNFGYFVNDSRDIENNKNISSIDKIKIITFVKNILFHHLETHSPEKLYIHAVDFNDKARLKKDDMYINFLSKAKLPDGYIATTEFTDYGKQNVIKKV